MKPIQSCPDLGCRLSVSLLLPFIINVRLSLSARSVTTFFFTQVNSRTLEKPGRSQGAILARCSILARRVSSHSARFPFPVSGNREHRDLTCWVSMTRLVHKHGHSQFKMRLDPRDLYPDHLFSLLHLLFLQRKPSPVSPSIHSGKPIRTLNSSPLTVRPIACFRRPLPRSNAPEIRDPIQMPELAACTQRDFPRFRGQARKPPLSAAVQDISQVPGSCVLTDRRKPLLFHKRYLISSAKRNAENLRRSRTESASNSHGASKLPHSGREGYGQVVSPTACQVQFQKPYRFRKWRADFSFHDIQRPASRATALSGLQRPAHAL